MSIAPRQPQIIPYLFYRDVPAALDFLCGAFGFKEEMRAETPSGGMHGEASFQGQLVMMGQGAHERSLKTPRDAGAATMGVFIYLDDVDKHYYGRQGGGRGNRRSAEGCRIRTDLLGGGSRGASLVLHDAAEGWVRPARVLRRARSCGGYAAGLTSRTGAILRSFGAELILSALKIILDLDAHPEGGRRLEISSEAQGGVSPFERGLLPRQPLNTGPGNTDSARDRVRREIQRAEKFPRAGFFSPG